MSETTVKLGGAGRLVIPVKYRREMGIAEGERLVIHLENGTLEIMTPNRAAEKAQSIIRKHIPKGRKLAEELIRDRKKEADDE